MNKQEFIKNLLESKDINNDILSNIDDLTKVIPEIKDMMGFEHRHPHHHLDVWEHTLYALKLSPQDFDVRLVVLLHDIGKPHSYQEEDGVRRFKGHPKMSSLMSDIILKRLGFDKDYVNYICEIISRHDTPLTREDIMSYPEFSKIIFEVQKCDALAHNPKMNKKRLEYIKNIEEIFKDNIPNM